MVATLDYRVTLIYILNLLKIRKVFKREITILEVFLVELCNFKTVLNCARAKSGQF